MNELNTTGFLHNRGRDSSIFFNKASFYRWRWGEKYFAQKLIDCNVSAKWRRLTDASTGVDSQELFASL